MRVTVALHSQGFFLLGITSRNNLSLVMAQRSIDLADRFHEAQLAGKVVPHSREPKHARA